MVYTVQLLLIRIMEWLSKFIQKQQTQDAPPHDLAGQEQIRESQTPRVEPIEQNHKQPSQYKKCCECFGGSEGKAGENVFGSCCCCCCDCLGSVCKQAGLCFVDWICICSKKTQEQTWVQLILKYPLQAVVWGVTIGLLGWLVFKVLKMFISFI